MHTIQPTPSSWRPPRKSFHALLLLSLGWSGCGLFGQNSPEDSNHAPSLTQVTATPASVNEVASTTLAVTATDPDGDPLTYTWTQTPATPVGTFGTETGSSRTWTAPAVPADTTFTLHVTVSDGKDGTAEGSVDVGVKNVPTVNRAPTVDAAITAPGSVIAGDTVNLSIGATDQDGDILTYAWTVDPAGAGTFTNPTAAAAQWRSGDLAAATSYSFLVTVSDGHDSVTRSVNVEVSIPSYARDIQPIWDAQCTRCHNSSTASRGGLNLDAGKSWASMVNIKSNNAPCISTNLARVLPKQPDDSLLVKKLIANPLCGTRMPQDNLAYFDEHPGELTRIRSWILADAPNN
ncbi:hypothetical protein D187_003194 [Cystobacter fuscus DSM 2262]|uniref:PKD/Chitinase domain-containing protein n=1 Tax=Cystobacter fuscus (strain ATCC 25194 / DSM 2262 / NBRC 100088 / M29) TaxID=1242864 RepID=S9P495_CYSF2|nr:hypothetical protein [Cystobacter fuscus]EPX59290.1 hypothetical protein D187_003194 [Cystobacter fuscus DSM 2262]